MSGLTDVDAITLSTAQLVDDGRLPAETGWRLILVAVMSNLVFKLGMVASLGSRAFARRFGALVAVALVAGISVIVFWR